MLCNYGCIKYKVGTIIDLGMYTLIHIMLAPTEIVPQLSEVWNELLKKNFANEFVCNTIGFSTTSNIVYTYNEVKLIKIYKYYDGVNMQKVNKLFLIQAYDGCIGYCITPNVTNTCYSSVCCNNFLTKEEAKLTSNKESTICY